MRSRLQVAVLPFALALLTIAFLSVDVRGFDPSRADELYALRGDLKNVEQMIAELEDVLPAADDAYPILWRLARGYEWLGRYTEERSEKLALFERGKEYAEAAAASNPSGVDGLYWKAILIGRVGETRGILQSLSAAKGMRETLEAVLELEGDHAGATYVMAMLYQKLPGWPLSFGSKTRSRELFERAVELAPENTTYKLGLAQLLIEMGDRAEAKELLEQVLRMDLTPGEETESAEDKQQAERLLQQLNR